MMCSSDKNKRKILFVLRTSKRHWLDSEPQMVKISSTSACNSRMEIRKNKNQFCPYQLLRKYSSVHSKSRSPQESFFVFRDRSPVKPEQFRWVMKKTLDKCGVDSRLFSGHSFRIGCGTDLLKLGVLVETIKNMGRWHSNAVYRYLKL